MLLLVQLAPSEVWQDVLLQVSKEKGGVRKEGSADSGALGRSAETEEQ